MTDVDAVLPGETTQKHEVRVLYDGFVKEIAYDPNALVRALLEAAIRAFGITQNVHILALYTEAGVELNNDLTAKNAGVKDHEKLILRPRQVVGG